jgi:hypothetical protein
LQDVFNQLTLHLSGYSTDKKSHKWYDGMFLMDGFAEAAGAATIELGGEVVTSRDQLQ